MFKMWVESAYKIGRNISVGGSCENKDAYTSKLKDDSGNIYETYIPLGKDLVIDDDSIMICFTGDMDKESLKGLVLQAAY